MKTKTDQDAECRGMDINERLQGVLQVLRPERHQGKPVGRKFRRDVIAPGRKSTISPVHYQPLAMYSGLYKHDVQMMQEILKGHHAAHITLGETLRA